MYNDKIYFLSMKVYGRKDGKFNDKQRAIVEFSRPIPPGSPVMFQSNNMKLFGEVLACVGTEPGSDLHKMFTALNGDAVCIYVHDQNELRPEHIL